MGVTAYCAGAGAAGTESTRNRKVTTRVDPAATLPISAPVTGFAPEGTPSTVKLPATNDIPAGRGAVMVTLLASALPPELLKRTV